MQKHSVKGMYRRGKQWWLRYTPAPGAAQVRISLETEFEDAAAAKAVEIKNAPALVSSGEFLFEMEVYLSDGLKTGKLAPHTALRRRSALKRFAKECGISRIRDITAEACERWVTFCRTTSTPLTARTQLMNVAAFCTWLMRKQKIRENPARRVEMGKIVAQARKNFLPKDKVRALIAKAPNDDLRFILYCGFHAGMRKLEITEARPDWFRIAGKKGSVHIQRTPTYTPKDKEERSIPLTAEFVKFLTRYLAKLPKGATWVLHPFTKGKSTLYRVWFYPEFLAYIESQKLRCSMHDMRRSFVSNKLIEDGRMIFKLARWTGTDIQTLQKYYGHLLLDDADIEAGL